MRVEHTTVVHVQVSVHSLCSVHNWVAVHSPVAVCSFVAFYNYLEDFLAELSAVEEGGHYRLEINEFSLAFAN